jgi:ABC-type dipeptide/oligopeptide/nickel transport system permease component
LNSGRSALIRGIATALAIIVVVFGLAAALGGLGLAAWAPIFDGKIIGEIAARLLVTIEPVPISFIVAAALGFVLTLPSAPALRVAIAVIVTGLRSLPVFTLAVAVMIVAILRLPFGSCLSPCTFTRQLAPLVMPVAVLMTYQLPHLVEFFDGRRARSQHARMLETSSVRGLALLFADRLPSLVSAAMIGEIIYGRAGEGRWLGIPGSGFIFSRDASVFTLFLIFNALGVLVIRCVVELLVRRDKTSANAGE